jgi:hypothetical protein
MTRNFILTYDLNGPRPSHAEMDRHIAAFAAEYGRILETVWYIRSSATLQQVYDYMNSKLSLNDRIMVIEARNAHVRNLLVPTENLQEAWAKAA